MQTLLDIQSQAKASVLAEDGLESLSAHGGDLRLQNAIMQTKSSEADRHRQYLSCKVHVSASLDVCVAAVTQIEDDLAVVCEDGGVVCRLESRFVGFLTESQRKLEELEVRIGGFDQEKQKVEKQIQKAKHSPDHREIVEIMEVFERTFMENSILKCRLEMETMANELLSENVNVTIGKAKSDKNLAGKLLSCQHRLSDEIENLKREIHRANILAVCIS